METARVSRKLTPAQVARRLGITARAVQLWVSKEQAPATQNGRAGRNQRMFLNLDEFRAWCLEHGKPIRETPDAAAGAEIAELDADAPEDSVFGAALARTPAELLEQLRTRAAMLAAKLGQTSDPAASQKLAGSFEKISNEIRRLEADELRRQRDAGEWIRRADAESLLVGLARRVREHLEAMAEPAAGAVLARAAEAGVTPPDRTGFERAVAGALGGEIERVLTAVAGDVEAAGGEL